MESQWKGFAVFVFAIVVFVLGMKTIKAAAGAEQKYAQDMKSRVDVHQSRYEFAKTDYALQNVQSEMQFENEIARARQEVELLKLQTEKRRIPIEELLFVSQNLLSRDEIELRRNYINAARQNGLSVDQYMNLNEVWKRKLIDFEAERLNNEEALRHAFPPCQ